MQESGYGTVRIGAKRPFGFRWHGEDLPAGVTILSATKAVSPATGLTVEEPVVNSAADGVYFWATGVAADSYVVTITAVRSDGGTVKEDYLIEVPVVALSGAALVTLAEVRSFIGLKAGSTIEADAKLFYIIEAVSVAFAASVDCDLLPVEDIEEKRDGTGKSYLYLDHWPIPEDGIESVVEDGVTLTENTDFYVNYEQGILEKPTGGKWTTSRRGVVVTYEAGYGAVPADVRLAAIIESARAFGTLDKQMFGETSRTQEGEGITINTDELLPSTLETLGRYRRTRI